MKYDPVLEQHLIAAGGQPPPPVDASGFPGIPQEIEAGSRKLPLFIGFAALGAMGGLLAFKMGGFKFVFGAKVGSA